MMVSGGVARIPPPPLIVPLLLMLAAGGITPKSTFCIAAESDSLLQNLSQAIPILGKWRVPEVQLCAFNAHLA